VRKPRRCSRRRLSVTASRHAGDVRADAEAVCALRGNLERCHCRRSMPPSRPAIAVNPHCARTTMARLATIQSL
jgi:hypothetical protein